MIGQYTYMSSECEAITGKIGQVSNTVHTDLFLPTYVRKCIKHTMLFYTLQMP